jgi:kinesin family protein 5
MSVQLNELRLHVEKLEFDNKESVITVDILKEQNTDARNELDELKRTITELKSSQKDPSAEDKEKKKQEKMALMMAQFDMARIMSSLIRNLATNHTPYVSLRIARVLL